MTRSLSENLVGRRVEFASSGHPGDVGATGEIVAAYHEGDDVMLAVRLPDGGERGVWLSQARPGVFTVGPPPDSAAERIADALSAIARELPLLRGALGRR